MIDFKLIKIKLFNFACYYGENEINFSNKSDKNIFLFRLPNGYGKTTLFHAIKWGFYGESIEYFKDSSKIEIKDFLNNKLNPSKDLCFVEITFKYGEEIYNLKRIYQPIANNKLSSFTLVKGGREIKDRVKAQEELEQIIPKNFSDFFMFDGEQLSKFMSAQEKIYEDSIHQLLGLKQLRVLRDDLKKMQKNYDNRIIQLKTTDSQVESKQGLIEGIIKDIQNEELKIKTYEEKINSNEKIKEGLETHRLTYENLPKVMDDLNKINNLQSNLSSEIAVIKNNLSYNYENLFVNFIKTDLSLFIQENNKKLEEINELCGLTDEQAETQKIKEDILQKSIPMCNVCGHKLNDPEIQKLKKEQNKINESLEIFKRNSEVRDELKEQNELFEDFLNNLERFDFQKALDNLREKKLKHSEFDTKKKELEKESQREEYGSLAKINREISLIEEENTKKRDQIKLIREKIKKYEEQTEEIRREIKRLGHDDKITKKTVDLSEYTSKMIKLLNEVLEKCTQSKREKIIKKSNELFLSITNKPKEYKGIEFKDENSYSFTIKTHENKAVTNPSKGEKQVLAMSFLLGLNQYTGINNIILMDTPVASLDDIHSAGIGKALSKLKNQVIFLAQPQELAGEIYKNMSSSIVKEFIVERKDYNSSIKEMKNGK